MSTNTLEDFQINIKIKLAALWASVTFLYIYGDYFELYVPEKLSDMIAKESMLDTPMKLFLAALMLAVPSLMICLSVLLKPIYNKWLNIIAAVFFTFLMLLIAFTSYEEWREFYVFYAILESILTATILLTALKWPKTNIDN